MRWLKIGPACEYLGGINSKLLYAAVRRGECRAAHIGQGRNLLFCDEWLNLYAEHCAERPGLTVVSSSPRKEPAA